MFALKTIVYWQAIEDKGKLIGVSTAVGEESWAGVCVFPCVHTQACAQVPNSHSLKHEGESLSSRMPAAPFGSALLIMYFHTQIEQWSLFAQQYEGMYCFKLTFVFKENLCVWHSKMEGGFYNRWRLLKFNQICWKVLRVFRSTGRVGREGSLVRASLEWEVENECLRSRLLQGQETMVICPHSHIQRGIRWWQYLSFIPSFIHSFIHVTDMCWLLSMYHILF